MRTARDLAFIAFEGGLMNVLPQHLASVLFVLFVTVRAD